MPFSIGFNRTNRRQANQDAARPAAAQPAQANAANAPGTHPGFFQRRSQRRNPLQAEMAAQGQRTPAGQAAAAAAPAPLTRRELIAHWNEWAQSALTDRNALPGEHEWRMAAVDRMKDHLKRAAIRSVVPVGRPATSLNLGNLQLSSLPEHLPPGLLGLGLRGCRFSEFPRSLPDTLESLNLAFNQLTTLPGQLPESLRHLYLDHNQLTHLPHTLRGNLTKLDVSSNQLTALPAHLPPTLTELNVSANQLQRLPETLPDSLEHLLASGNRLTSFPSRLPPRLSYAYLIHNQISDVDPSALTRHTVPCRVEMNQNPLSDRSVERLGAALNSLGHNRLQVHFDRTHAHHAAQPAQAAQPGQPAPAARTSGTLGQAASAWALQPQSNIDATARLWQSFAFEPGANAFSQFLDRLRGTVNFGNRQFKASVAEWLTHLQNNPSLRHDTFALSEGATTSCEDRVSLTLNGMRQLRLASDVARGDYDQRLPELITLARGMFRLDQLEGIAREKAASLNFVDEIEVYLAYQVKLRESLALPLDTPDMRFFNISYVTQGDLRQAEARVLAAERSDFSSYLACEWQPWQSVLQRLAPEQHEQAQEDLIEAMGDRFNNRLQARLRALDLTHDADAQRTLGPQVQAEISREINGRLTRNFLASHGLLEHVAAPGSTAASRPTPSRW